MQSSLQEVGVTVGLGVIALLALVVVWKITKSFIKLMLWLAALAILTAGAFWLLTATQVASRPPEPRPGAKAR